MLFNSFHCIRIKISLILFLLLISVKQVLREIKITKRNIQRSDSS